MLTFDNTKINKKLIFLHYTDANEINSIICKLKSRKVVIIIFYLNQKKLTVIIIDPFHQSQTLLVFEKIILGIILQFVKNTGRTNSKQFRFFKNKGTVNALDVVYNGINENKAVAATFILTKAFDTVDHEIFVPRWYQRNSPAIVVLKMLNLVCHNELYFTFFYLIKLYFSKMSFNLCLC